MSEEFTSTDEINPFYCPSVPAALFLETVRQRVQRRDSAPDVQDQSLSNTPELTRSSDEDSFPSFARILEKSISEEDLLELHFRPDCLQDSANEDHIDSSILSVSSMHWQQHHALLLGSRLSEVSHQAISAARKDSSAVSVTFSDFAGPPLHERSIIEANEDSFELSAKAEKLQYFKQMTMGSPDDVDCQRNLARLVLPKSVAGLTSRVCALQDELYGLPIGTETPRGISHLIFKLNTILPGVRLQEKLAATGPVTHQHIVDTLASNGFLNTRVLNILRTSEIDYLDLSKSTGDEGGLNLDSNELFIVFSKPNSFLFLAEINLTGSQVKETDLLHLQHLPRLARLWLASCNIGNEAIFYLTPLKRSLTDLDIAYNPKINDDTIPALLIMKKLQYLTFHGTGITLVGVRRLAKTLKEQRRDMEVEVPRQCEEYINKLSRHYLVELGAPLVTDPEAVPLLTTTALSYNLNAHDETGSAEDKKARLACRLRDLLETREADLLVRKLILQEPLD